MITALYLLLAALFLFLLRIAPIACAYKAKILASAHFLQRRRWNDGLNDDVGADDYRILKPFRASLNEAEKSVTCSFLGLRPRTAVYREGWGATLLSGRSRTSLPQTPLPQPPPRSREEEGRLWPEGGACVEKTAGADLKALAGVLQNALGEKPGALRRRTRAVAVAVDGRLIGESYASGFDAQTPLPGWSMTKSVMAALIGRRIHEGRLSLEDDRLFPEWNGPGDPRSKITVEDLLRMRSGLAFEELYASPLSEVNRMLFLHPDSAGFAARRVSRHAPGTAWGYDSGTTNLLSRALRRSFTSDAEYHRYPRTALFDPLGMRSAVVETDATGTFLGSSFLFATAQDWLRFGQFMLDDGLVEGRRLLPEGWRDFSSRLTPQSPGNYGAHWWLKLPADFGGETAEARNIPKDAFYALGHEGQTLSIIASKKLVVLRLGLSVKIRAWNQAAFLDAVLKSLK